jgi:hypothetical protein
MESREIGGSITIKTNISHGEIEERVLAKILEEEKWIRRDAEIELKSKVPFDKVTFQIKGEIFHRKINVKKGYYYFP